ncbi:rab11 family-interacting protein 3 isoform X2 [Episyrphus balteatus]|uniref:rab11 family-interacting protein 3 isoform X2 n=1 Tax=Episyrphus balteatus TaxID=286459 RepID=UPI002486236F|nr:rab11 family-interacting protein 3 isoform X2 [Episyrphus balteatus]
MNSQPASQPESIDLAYDMWAGQFEFVGTPSHNNNNTPNNNNNILNNNNSLQYRLSDKNSSQYQRRNSTDSLEDLNLNFTSPATTTTTTWNGSDFSKQPILIDQETFLSLNPNDFDDIGSSGPNSLVFIENKFNESPPSAGTDGKLINLEALTNKLNCKPNNNNTNGFKLENLKNFKNKLLCDFSEKNNNNNNNGIGGQTDNVGGGRMNGINAELCENLNEQLELLQRQVTDLADTQTDRTTRTKTEYAVLQTRYHMLEEQFRESELRAEERLAEEQKRHRELLARHEREAALQNENCQIKIRTIEIEANALREEAQRLRVLCDKQASDLHNTEEKLELARDSIVSLQQDLSNANLLERKYEQEKKASEDLMVEMSRELERLRSESGRPAMPSTSPEALRLEELHQELDELRIQNKSLEEQNEELQAAVLTRGVEEGRHLLNGTLNSLAQELEEMSQTQLQQAFQEKEDENTRLKHYIDTILLNIVENYPQLLEVKPIDRSAQN